MAVTREWARSRSISTVNQTSLVVDGAKVTLSGGTVTMSNSAANYIFGAATADTLTNQETISGAGHIGNGQMTLTNSGTINSDDSAGITIQANGGAKNTGTLEATAGSTLALTAMTVTNTGGSILADASQLQLTSATINGGAADPDGGVDPEIEQRHHSRWQHSHQQRDGTD